MWKSLIIATSVVGSRYPALGKFHRVLWVKGILSPAVFLDQRGVHGIFFFLSELVPFSWCPWKPLKRRQNVLAICFSLSVLAMGSLLALFISACFNASFFTLAFGKLSGLSCVILNSLFSQAACVVLTLLSCKDFLLSLLEVFFFPFYYPPWFW